MHLARQAQQVAAGNPGLIARLCGNSLTIALTAAGYLAAAGRVCAAGLAQSREAGDMWTLLELLPQMVIVELLAGRIEDAAAHLREALQTAARTGGRVNVLDGLECCGQLCAATGRPAEAVTVWAARGAFPAGRTCRPAPLRAPPGQAAARGAAGARARPDPRD